MEPRSVLVVDDSQDFIDLIQSAVEGAFPSCKVYHASNPEHAKQIIDENKLEVVITDFLMGPYKGSDIVNYCLGTETNVIVLTGAAIDEVKDLIPETVSVYNKYSTLQNNRLAAILRGLTSLEIPL